VDDFAMTDERVQQVVRAYQDLAAIKAVAESRDGLVVASAGVYGELRTLELDPRIYREYDVDSLATAIVDTARAAAGFASRQGFSVATVLLPPNANPDRTDLAFDPMLTELDRLIEGTGPR
jgi:DNA-binding protein YbaB